jgi:acetyltransferase-like isoleucine patch superfamily enzyme
LRKLLNHIRNLLMFKLRYPWVVYGKNVHVQWSARFWSAHKSVRLGNHVGIGRWCDISTDLVIGNHVLVAGATAFLSRDAHSAYSPGKTMFEAPRGDSCGIVIEDDVWIGWGAIILSGVTVGRGSIIAAGSIVTKDVPRYSIVTSRPSQVLRQRFSPEEVEFHESELRRKNIIQDADAPSLVCQPT